MSPKRIQLRGAVGKQLQSTIRIERLKAYPYSVKNVKAKDGKNLRFELKESAPDKDTDGYRLIVTNTKNTAGSYRDMITIETDSKFRPTIRIPVVARIYASKKQGK
jgi:hypothetical protein